MEQSTPSTALALGSISPTPRPYTHWHPPPNSYNHQRSESVVEAEPGVLKLSFRESTPPKYSTVRPEAYRGEHSARRRVAQRKEAYMAESELSGLATLEQKRHRPRVQKAIGMQRQELDERDHLAAKIAGQRDGFLHLLAEAKADRLRAISQVQQLESQLREQEAAFHQLSEMSGLEVVSGYEEESQAAVWVQLAERGRIVRLRPSRFGVTVQLPATMHLQCALQHADPHVEAQRSVQVRLDAVDPEQPGGPAALPFPLSDAGAYGPLIVREILPSFCCPSDFCSHDFPPSCSRSRWNRIQWRS